jgi:hypothetical protein
VDLLTKFQPDYRPVKEVEKEIQDTRDLIAKEENTPLHDETTDVDPTHMWVRSELAKADSDMVGLRARQSALSNVIAKYQSLARDLDQKAILLSDLTREAKAQEENYLLYQHKREEARISDQLDAGRILNVSMAEDTSVPALPKHSPFLFGLVGFVMMLCMGTATIWTVEYFDSTLRTPAEVETFVNIPVLAAVPYGNGFSTNGNGRNGHHKYGIFSGNGHSNGNGHHKIDIKGNGNGNANRNGIKAEVGAEAFPIAEIKERS